MSELIQRTFRVSFDIQITLNTIDAQVISAARQHMNLIGDDDFLTDAIRREQVLLQALSTHPETLRAYLLHRVAEATEYIHSEDDSLQTIQATIDDATLIEDLKDDLATDDYAFFKGVCDDGIFYDNTSFFEEAISIHQSNFTIVPLDAVNR